MWYYCFPLLLDPYHYNVMTYGYQKWWICLMWRIDVTLVHYAVFISPSVISILALSIFVNLKLYFYQKQVECKLIGFWKGNMSSFQPTNRLSFGLTSTMKSVSINIDFCVTFIQNAVILIINVQQMLP
jgi:hypothetical protein